MGSIIVKRGYTTTYKSLKANRQPEKYRLKGQPESKGYMPTRWRDAEIDRLIRNLKIDKGGQDR